MTATKRKAGMFVSVALLVVLVIISFAPTYVARYLIENQLDELGIAHTGIGSLNINIWKREIWAGPVQFGMGDDPRGKLGHIGIKIRYLPFLDQHAMVEQVLVRDIDVVVERHAQDGIILNGIPLRRLAQSPASSPEPEPEIASAWGAGLGNFEIQDSRVLFRNADGGVLRVDVKSLSLDDFLTWSPDEPGKFALQARVNDIILDWKGEARPFAKQITLDMDAQILEAALPKIIEFTGPVGLERRHGVYYANLKHQLLISHNGRVEGESQGSIELIGADYAMPDVLELLLDRAVIHLETKYLYTESGDFSLSGAMDSDIGSLDVSLANANGFGIGGGKVQLNDLDFSLGHDAALRVAVKPVTEINDAWFIGQFELSVDRILNILAFLQSLSTQEAVTTEQTGLADWSGNDMVLPSSTVKVKSLQSPQAAVDFSSANGDVKLNMHADMEAADIEVMTDNRATHIGHLKSGLRELALTTGNGEMQMTVSGSNVLSNNQVKGDIGEGSIDIISADLQKLDLLTKTNSLSLDVIANSAINNVKLTSFERGNIPVSVGQVGIIASTLKQGAIRIDGDHLDWSGRADVVIEDLGIDVAQGKVAAVKFGRFEVLDAQVNQDLALVTESILLQGLDIFIARHFIENLRADKQQPIAQTDAMPPETAVAEQSKEAGGSTSAQIKLGRLALQDGARIRFHDDVVSPDVTLDTRINTFQLSNLDTQAADERAQLEIDATINEFTKLGVSGWAQSPGKQADAELSVKLANLDLPPISPYAAKFVGVHIETGQASTEANIQAVEGKLNGDIGLDLLKLAFETLSDEDAKRIEANTGMPIETAIGLLQDSDGHIHLDLPVSGTIDEPSVDYSDAIQQAIGGAMKRIFPPTLIASMLVSTAKGVGVSFEPVEFAPGTVELSPEAKAYSENIVELLQSRPKLRLSFCGRATAADLAAIDLAPVETEAVDKPQASDTENVAAAADAESEAANQQAVAQALNNLAVERMRAVRRYLISEKGIDAGRVAECRSTGDSNDAGAPRVDISL